MRARLLHSAIFIPLLLFVIGGENTAYALETKQRNAKAASIEEVARMIRKRKQWMILDASPRHKASGSEYFRFKLLGNDGTVRILNIDPSKPNLRRLE